MTTNTITASSATAQNQYAGSDNTPTNAVTGKAYFGAKAQRLLDEAAYRSYPTNEWATLKQWNSVKETIAKGEKGTLMIHLDKFPDGTERENRSFLYNRCQLVNYKG